MTLHAGAIDPDTRRLTPDDSLACTIERALNDLAPLRTGEDPMWRRKLALAIARGVLKHLHDNAGSVRVTVPNTSGAFGTHKESPTIDVDLGGWS